MEVPVMPCYSLALNCPSQARVWEAWPSLVRMGGGTFKRGACRGVPGGFLDPSALPVPGCAVTPCCLT